MTTKIQVDLSKLLGQIQIKKIDENTAKRYRVVEEKIDLGRMKAELAELEAMEEPSEEELINWAKINHPYYFERIADMDVLKRKLKDLGE